MRSAGARGGKRVGRTSHEEITLRRPIGLDAKRSPPGLLLSPCQVISRGKQGVGAVARTPDDAIKRAHPIAVDDTRRNGSGLRPPIYVGVVVACLAVNTEVSKFRG